jgi:hypothetical protein
MRKNATLPTVQMWGQGFGAAAVLAARDFTSASVAPSILAPVMLSTVERSDNQHA